MSAVPAGALRPFHPAFPATRPAGACHGSLPGYPEGRGMVAN
ncbi:hypothetical protein [Burkholderia stabilis]|nr:hypothetical protein [Burkholderia stabilis]